MTSKELPPVIPRVTLDSCVSLTGTSWATVRETIMFGMDGMFVTVEVKEGLTREE